eukprot:scaffold7619_cov239-Pinguiococcus_pyrenoidosus.AAC.2
MAQRPSRAAPERLKGVSAALASCRRAESSLLHVRAPSEAPHASPQSCALRRMAAACSMRGAVSASRRTRALRGASAAAKQALSSSAGRAALRGGQNSESAGRRVSATMSRWRRSLPSLAQARWGVRARPQGSVRQQAREEVRGARERVLGGTAHCVCCCVLWRLMRLPTPAFVNWLSNCSLGVE